MASDFKIRIIKTPPERLFKVKVIKTPPKVKLVMAKGEKGEPGEKGEKGDTGGITKYQELPDKPQINDVTLEGNQTFEDLGAASLSNIEINNIINSIV